MLCLLATFTAYVERVGFSIAYTAMAKKADISEAVKGTVLSAFYWGYGISQVSMHHITLHLYQSGQLVAPCFD
jgi:ACS family sodium-dependent inorganic phosphate cotransporter